MKRKFVFVLAILILCTAVFADDAKVMPARVGRVYLAPTFGFANGAFDSDAKYNAFGEGEGKMKMFNLGFALEYGIIKWITGAIQWAPGVNVWSDVDMSLGTNSTVNANGLADLFIGAKMQILGEQGPVENESIRFAVAPGVKVPLPGPDYEEQFKNIAKSDPVTAANIDKHVIGIGARVYFDYVINNNFFINLHSEFIGYPVKGDLDKAGLDGYGADLTLKGWNENPASAVMGKIKSDGVDYGYDLTFELEPVFSASIGEKTVLTAGLPFNYKYTPGTKYGVSYPSGVQAALLGANPMSQFIADSDPTHLFSLKPGVSVFFMGWALPMEFKLQYAAPIAGENIGRALHSITFQARVYFKI